MEGSMICVAVTCLVCGSVEFLGMTEQQYDDLCTGEKLIQNIFPDMSLSEREMLISGICPDCQLDIFH